MTTKMIVPSPLPRKPSTKGALPMNPLESSRRANGVVGMKKGGKVARPKK